MTAFVLRATAVCVLLLWNLNAFGQAVTGTGPADDPTRQTDADWVDDRWSRTEVGQFLGATIDTPGKKTPKGIVIKIGENNEASVCFDSDLLRYAAGWSGGFLKMHGQRYGLIAALSPVGEMQVRTSAEPGWARDGSFQDPRSQKLGALPRDWAKYKGLYLSGKRVVLSYSVGKSSVLDSPWYEERSGLGIFSRSLEISGGGGRQVLRVADVKGGQAKVDSVDGLGIGILNDDASILAVTVIGTGAELIADGSALNVAVRAENGPAGFKVLTSKIPKDALPAFVQAVRESVIESLALLTSGGPARWTQNLETKGVLDRTGGPFAIDTVTIPFENPWNALFFLSGHDFFSNGDAAVAAIHGDVWRVSGLDEKLEKVTWKRFASGLYQPLGLKIVGDKVHVLERDQITVLHDLNGDGEADYYENLNNDCISAGGGHSYATCLETDSAGNFYFTKCAEGTPHGGALLKVARDGSSLEVVATGFRNPNGLGIGPGDFITVADQQGDWVPETRLDHIRQGGFYGYIPMHKRRVAPTSYDPPLCWVPRTIDNSAGGQVWVPKGAAGGWGALGGQMLHLSFGRCAMMLVLRDPNGVQGAVVPLPGRFASGVCRGRFNPKDGNIYVSGLRGWQTAAVRDGCFQRVRAPKAAALPVAFAVGTNSVTISLSEPVDRELAEDIESYSAERWNYRWSSTYGSPDFSVESPEKPGRDPVRITAAKLATDGKSILLSIPEMRPAMQLALRYNLETEKGDALQSVIYITVNKPGP